MRNFSSLPLTITTLGIVIASTCLPLPMVMGYTPDGPVVQGMVDKGIAYIEAEPVSRVRPGVFNGKAGGVVLAGYTHLKCRHDPDNPVVKRGVTMAIDILKELKDGGGTAEEHKSNYAIAVSILLLAEVNPSQYRNDLQYLLRRLLSGQHPGGGFRYHGDKQGDVSQTQYGVLAIWTLDRKGIPLSYNNVVNCTKWLLRVQDIAGSWPYKGSDPGMGSPLIKQRKPDETMGLAGASSILIAGDALGLWGESSDESDPGIPGMPKAVRLYIEDSNSKRRKKAKNVSQAAILNSVKRFEGWDAQNSYVNGGPRSDWYYYMIYTRERYESFLEIARGSEKNKSPAWYNQIVEELKTAQGDDGAWTETYRYEKPVSTSLALLTLIRSTQKSIGNSNSATLSGGREFPSDTTNIRVEGAQIKGQAVAAQVTDLLSILSEDSDGLNGRRIPDNLVLDPTPDGRRAQLDRLERMVRGSRSYMARRLAAQLLGKSDELRVAPSLIFAINDLDTPTRKFSRDGLRFISRKFDGFGLPEKPIKSEVGEDDYPAALSRWKAKVSIVQDQWRDWYRTVDPTYIFLDYDL